MKAVDGCQKANLFEGMRMSYYVVHDWLYVVNVELTIMRVLILIREINQSD